VTRTVAAFTLFETAIGTCGIAWTERGVVGVQLPEENSQATRARLQRRYPHATEQMPSADVAGAIDRIAALLRGEPADLTGVALDMDSVTPFERAVYRTARDIPPGSTLTYGEIARHIGQPGAARDVGVALARNPFAIVVPCHRVVAANGKLGGFSGAGGTVTKLKLLAIEVGRGAGPLFD
jgi:methylated-DNA-[protein]-cysteine S-methyltransferase